MKKITTTTLTDDNVFSAIDKIHPEEGDLLLFYVKTDDNGDMYQAWNVVSETSRIMGELLKKFGADGIFIMDKICLFSIQDADELTRTLEKQISAIQKAKNKLGDIKNRKLGDPYFIINMKDAGDQD